MNARGSTSVMSILLCACAAVVWLLVSSGSAASAAVTHEYLSRITEVPAGAGVTLPGPFKELSDMSIDGGKLYLGEKFGGGVQRIDAFDSATGAFVSQFSQPASFGDYPQALAAGHSTGEEQVYVSGFYEGARTIAVFSGEGQLIGHWSGSDTPAGSFGEVRGLAVDGSTSLTDWAAGDVYTTDLFDKVVDVFQPKPGGGEEYVAQLEPEVPFEGPRTVAVDRSNGDVLVVDGVSSEVVDVFEPTVLGKYALIRQLTGPPGGTFGVIESIAIDGNNGDVYLGEGPALYQFDEAGQYLGRLAGTPKGPFQRVVSLAVDPAAPHDLYAGDVREHEPAVIDVFGPNLVIPDVTTTPASEVRAAGEGTIDATLNGTVNPDGAGEASCRFAWGTTREFGQTAACEPEKVANGEAPVSVHAALGGAGVLAPDTTYYYRLQATNQNGTNRGENSEDQEFTTPGPGLRGEAVSVVRAESVTFDARINPHGRPTSYYFQYGPSSSYGTDVPAFDEAAPHGLAIGSGESVVEVSQHVQGLASASVYHYRVVAVTEPASGQIESFYGPDQTFVTQRISTPPPLPDGRRWEMVSPPQKEGVLLGWIYDTVVQAAADGSAFTDWTSFEPIENNAESAFGFRVSQFFGRGPDGWVSKTIAPPHTGPSSTAVGNGGEYRSFSEDLSKSVLQPFGAFTPLTSEATESTPYLRADFSNGDPGEPCVANCYEPLVTSAKVPAGVKFGGEPTGECLSALCGPYFLEGTPDLRHLVLETEVSLSSTPLEGNGGLYEWGDGHLQLLNVLPPGEANEHGGPVAARASLGDGEGVTRHAISNDGSRVIWMGRSAGADRHLYLRDTVNGMTIRLDTFQGVEKGPEANYVIRYLTASEDDSRVFFLDGERLTADSTADEQVPDLYEYDLKASQGSRLTDLSVATRSQEPADVAAVLGASGDGSYVYFAAAGALAPGATPGRCGMNLPSSDPPCNLYLRHDGTTTFIAALSQDDSPDWKPLAQMPARVSPDGKWLAFMSDESLTGYDTTDALSKQPDEEVYLYDAAHDKLICASCDPTGARPVGTPSSSGAIVTGLSGFPEGQGIAANVPPWTRFSAVDARYQSRYLSNSGRLFFDSNDALVPQDVNGTQDVYEYEPTAVGDCESANLTYSEHLGGCVALVSSGTSDEESAFLDASETGSDVFFLTAAKLVPADFDDQRDIYDAHECGAASACSAPAAAVPPPCDTGESCKAGQSAQPTLFGAPPSETFSGTGNYEPPPGSLRARSLTRQQKLARALSVCRHKHKHKQRLACKRRARRLYGARKRRGKAITSKRGPSRPAGSNGRS